MATKQEENTFKLSQLCSIQNLDNEDLFLVSDYENNKCYTRKLTYGMLTKYLSENPQLISSILADQRLADQIQEKVDTAVSAKADLSDVAGKYLPLSGGAVSGDVSILFGKFSGGENALAAGKNSFAYGSSVSAIGESSYAAGVNAATHASCSYVWNGDPASQYTMQPSASGTFNINPVDGLSGFRIGLSSLADVLSAVQASVDPMNMPVQVIKPVCDERMHLSVGIFKDKMMSDALVPEYVDSKTSAEFFSYFWPNGSESHWVQLALSDDGFSRESNNMPVVFDMPDVLKTLSIDYRQVSRIYIKYYWYYDLSGQHQFSDPYATTLPAATEVGANAQDSVNKSEFYELQQNVIPQSQAAEVDDLGFILAYSTKYSIIQSPVQDGAKIALMDYNEHKTYKIDLSTADDEDVQLEFYIGLANGNIEWSDVLNSEQHIFDRGKHYYIKIADEKIFVYDGDAVYASQDGDYLTSSDISSYCYMKSQTSSAIEISTAFDSKVSPNGILTSYADQHFCISANGTKVADLNCADFIKDGMLSSAELCGTQLIFTFNTDAGSTPISVDLSSFVDDYSEAISQLSNQLTAISGSVEEIEDNIEVLSSKLSTKSSVTFVDWED